MIEIWLLSQQGMTGESAVALGRDFSGISGAGMVVRYNHIANRGETDRKLKGRVNRIRKKIINIECVPYSHEANIDR